jgi:hypothetical protein
MEWLYGIVVLAGVLYGRDIWNETKPGNNNNNNGQKTGKMK